MTVRLPQSYVESRGGNQPLSALDYELMSERADALGRAGLKAEAALANLRLADGGNREGLLEIAAREVYALFIQREICGLKNGRDVIARYEIPGAVLARLGVSRKPVASGE